MKTPILASLLFLSFYTCIGQVYDSTIVFLDPFEVKFDSKLQEDIQSYVNNSQKRVEKFFADSPTKKVNRKDALLLSRLKKYQTNFDIRTAFAFSYISYLYSKLEGRYEVVPLRQKSNGDITELKKMAAANNSCWVIRISSIEFYINDNEEFSMAPNGKKGRLRVELFDAKTSSIALTQEIDADTSGIDWFLPCDSGEFKCIINHLVGNSTYELADYFLRWK